MIFLEYSILGIAAGGIYALIALGFIVIFKASQTFNFAMGEMMMVAGYIFYTASVLLQLDWYFSLAMSIAVSVVIALIMERFVLRPMMGRPIIALVMVTFGVGIMLRGIVPIFYGSEALQIPSLVARDPIEISEMLLIPGKTARSFLIAVGIVVALILFFRFSRIGIALRATASDQITSYAMGINVRWIFAFTWIIAAIIGAIAGILMASVNSLTASLGLVALNVLAVVILGGLNSIGGVLIAGLIIGWLEAITGYLFGSEWRDITPYILALLVLLIRPHGLFGTKPIERI